MANMNSHDGVELAAGLSLESRLKWHLFQVHYIGGGHGAGASGPLLRAGGGGHLHTLQERIRRGQDVPNKRRRSRVHRQLQSRTDQRQSGNNILN